MKRKLNYIIISLMVVLASCENKYQAIPDYNFTSIYFPLQYPLRTIILGDSRSDNTLDKQLKFNTGVVLGGVYKNSKTYTANFIVDNSLLDGVYLKDGVSKVLELPISYYTLAGDHYTVESGSISGLVQVQLKDAFLDDPLAFTGRYVIPLRIVSSTADSVLRGSPTVANPDKNITTHWDQKSPPKDFVLFGIKFINPYHGSYLHKGKNVSSSGTIIYSNKYVERNDIYKLATVGRNTVQSNGIAQNIGAEYGMNLAFDANDNIVISPKTGAKYQTTGTGKYVKNAEVWGGEKHHAMYLNYTYPDGATAHTVTDTLIFRDNGVVFEENEIIVK